MSIPGSILSRVAPARTRNRPGTDSRPGRVSLPIPGCSGQDRGPSLFSTGAGVGTTSQRVPGGRIRGSVMRTLVVSGSLLDSVSTRLREILPTRLDCPPPELALFSELEKRLAQVQPQMLVVVLSPDPEPGLALLNKVRGTMTGYIL